MSGSILRPVQPAGLGEDVNRRSKRVRSLETILQPSVVFIAVDQSERPSMRDCVLLPVPLGDMVYLTKSVFSGIKEDPAVLWDG